MGVGYLFAGTQGKLEGGVGTGNEVSGKQGIFLFISQGCVN